MGDQEPAPEPSAKNVSDRRKSRFSSFSVVKSEQALSRLRLRKGSYGFRSVPGIKPVDRSSQSAIGFKRPPLIFLPTYQLDSHHPFHAPTVEKIMNEAVDEFFTKEHKYNPQSSPALPMALSAEIMKRIKVMNYDRYRIISVVTLGQKRAQCYTNTISFIWDHERDTYIDVHREFTAAFLQATVFGVYLD